MKISRRGFRVAAWATGVVAVLLGVLYPFSYRLRPGPWSERVGIGFMICCRQACCYWWSTGHGETGLIACFIEASMERPWPTIWVERQWGNICVPLWIPLALSVGLSCICWYRSCGHKPGACHKCGYDLTGNVSGVCPECGGTVTRDLTATDMHV